MIRSPLKTCGDDSGGDDSGEDDRVKEK